jgi:hypothetical protein
VSPVDGVIHSIDPDFGPNRGGIYVNLSGDFGTTSHGVGQFQLDRTYCQQFDRTASFVRLLIPPSPSPEARQARIVALTGVGAIDIGTADFFYEAGVVEPPLPEGPSGVPPGRGLWRLTLHERAYTRTPLNRTVITELQHARSRRLERTLNRPARLSFTMSGRDPSAALIRELETEVVAWRWDAAQGADVPYFRGVVAQAEDLLSEQTHTLNINCHDYLAMIGRRFITRTLAFAQTDQDVIANRLLDAATNVSSTDNATHFGPAGYMPVLPATVPPDGNLSGRPYSGQLRDRTYLGSSNIGTMLDELAHVHGGFDYDVVPIPGADMDYLRIFYPAQGVTLADPVLEYGGAVTDVTRVADGTEYANFQRVLGNQTDAAAPQLYAESWNDDALSSVEGSVGLWQLTDNAADVSIQTTLDAQARGNLNRSGVLVPTYTIGLRSGIYRDGLLRMGDNVPLVVRSGRLDVATTVRIVGLTFDPGDDGTEIVSLTVGRPLTTLVDLMRAGKADVDALARR